MPTESRFPRLTAAARMTPVTATMIVVAAAALLFPAVGSAIGPDGANHTSQATAYGPITTGTTYAGTSAYVDDVDIYAVRSYLPNVNLVIDFKDSYSGGPTDCTFYTSCSLEVTVRDSNGSEIDPVGGYFVDPGAVTALDPITLPTAGTYYIDVGTSEYNVMGGLGGMAIPYDFSLRAAPGLAIATPTPAPAPCVVPVVHVGAKLATVEQQLAASNCALGQLRHRYNRRRPRGAVLALTAASGTHLDHGAPVSIIISAGPKPKPRRHRHRG
jgi:hypothetical protein